MLPTARIKTKPEDFVVDELPAYEPSGTGEHLYVRFTKRMLTTDEAVRAICAALGTNARDAGVAGMKDKVGITTQWMSVLTKDPDAEKKARELVIDGVTIHEAKRHGNKLKTGHLAGNRFAIKVQGVAADAREVAKRVLERLGREGVPNAFGPQRFGKFGDNAERAKSWLRGDAPAPRDPRLRRLHWSALQSAVFNAVLEMRVVDGTWRQPLEGDVLKAEPGGLFVCTDVQTDTARAARGDVSPTGPIVGVKMRAPSGRPAEIEREACAKILGEGFDLARTRALGEGTRRVLRLGVRELRVEEPSDGSLGVYFVLPKGAYATTVLGCVFRLESPTDGDADRTAEPEDS